LSLPRTRSSKDWQEERLKRLSEVAEGVGVEAADERGRPGMEDCRLLQVKGELLMPAQGDVQIRMSVQTDVLFSKACRPFYSGPFSRVFFTYLLPHLQLLHLHSKDVETFLPVRIMQASKQPSYT
jgi:hypothetical protein